jgi:protein-disulfide isomerase
VENHLPFPLRVAARAIAFALAVAAVGCGGGGTGAGTAASDDVVSQRVIEHFQKTVTTPGLTFKVTKLEDSSVPGWRKGNLEVSLGQQTQSVAFHITRDGKYLFRGDPVDLTVDPLVEITQKIKLENQPSRGPADAKVVVVEYSDFQCPFCSRVYTTVETQLMKEYGDRIRFVFKNYPLSSIHPWAEDGAVASECAFAQGNDAFWKMYDGLFTKQAEITADNFKTKAGEIAKDAGMDTAKFSECLDGKQTLEAVKADEKEAEALGVNSTPTFFVNGRRLAGAQSYESFKQIVDQALGGQG